MDLEGGGQGGGHTSLDLHLQGWYLGHPSAKEHALQMPAASHEAEGSCHPVSLIAPLRS